MGESRAWLQQGYIYLQIVSEQPGSVSRQLIGERKLSLARKHDNLIGALKSTKENHV